MDRAEPETAPTAAAAFRVVVPTRDSAPWIAALIAAYDRLGIRPLFIVDQRSTDGTFADLQRLGADAVEVLPAENYVEDIVWRIPSLTDAAWVLRIDDDEIPSRALLQWVQAGLASFITPRVAFPRRWAFHMADGRLAYARHRQLFYMSGRPDMLDPQIRLFRPDQVKYQRNIHTPGFTLEGGLHLAPPDSFICHFDWIARSFDERHAKLLRYEAALPGCGSALLYFYLPELLHPEQRFETPFETTEFDALAGAFSRYRTRARAGAAAA